MATSRLRVAMVGAGHISRQHGPAWLASPDAELVAVCDQDAARAESRARAWGVGSVYTDAAEMLRQERPDALDVVTRPETHTALVTLAAQAGCHVLCQKPLAATLDEARAMVETCERAGVRFMVMEMWRWLPWWRELRAQLDAGTIGPAHYLRVVGARHMLRRARPVSDTQPYVADMPKLIIYEMMIHWIDASRYLMGEIASVCARTAHLNPAVAGEDAALVVLGHTGGATSALDGSWAVPAEPPPWPSTREGDVVVEGRDGVLHFSPANGDLRLTTADGSRVVASYPNVEAGFQRAFDSCIGHFARRVRAGEPFESPASDNLRTLAATFAAYESAAAGQAVAPDTG